MNVDLIVSIYLDRGSTPLGSIILRFLALRDVSKRYKINVLISLLFIAFPFSRNKYGTKKRARDSSLFLSSFIAFNFFLISPLIASFGNTRLIYKQVRMIVY